MTKPDPEAWTETTSGRERVRTVVDTLDEPATVTEIAEQADVAWATADSELDRLVAENRVREIDSEGRTKYVPNPVQQFLDQILELIERNDRDELEARLVDYQSQLESLQDEHGTDTASEFRERLTAEDRSAEELQEIRNIATTWEALETERRLVKHALQLYDDVTHFSDSSSDNEVVFA